jgi:hypothetical protein
MCSGYLFCLNNVLKIFQINNDIKLGLIVCRKFHVLTVLA